MAHEWVNPSTRASRLLFWPAICGLCALPSVVIASWMFDPLGILAGVATVAAFYVWMTGSDAYQRLVSHPFVLRSISIGFGLRLFASIVLPIGMLADIVPGAIAIELGMWLHGTTWREIFPGDGPNRAGFGLTYSIALVHAASVQAMLWGLIFLLWLGQRLFLKIPLPENICRVCGYDLRASPVRCPECGTPRTAAASPSARSIRPSQG